MPSNRQVRVSLTITVVAVLAFLFFHSSETASNKAYYESTLAALDSKLHAHSGSETHSGSDARNSDHGIPPPGPPGQAANVYESKEYVPKGHPSKADEEKARVAAGSEDEDSAAADVKRKPPQVALGSGGDGQKVVKDSKGYATGEEGEQDLGKAGKNKDDDKTEAEREVEEELNSILKKSPIIIFSKSYCPYSKKAKHIFGLYNVSPAPYIVELDEHPLGAKLQEALKKLTGRRTVPNILISGTSIGGGDDVGILHEGGELVGKIRDLGGKRIMEARLKGVKETR